MEQILTAVYTVTTGYLVFVLGQITISFLINPINDHKKVIGKIQDAVIYYANVFSPMMNKATQAEAREKFRKLATQLVSTARVIPCYEFTSHIFSLPTLKNLESAHHSLVGLANSVGNENNVGRRIRALKKALNLWFI